MNVLGLISQLIIIETLRLTVVALDHDPPWMRVPLANLPPHEYVLLTLSSKYIVLKHIMSL